MNNQTVRQWWDLFKSEHPLTEVRVLGKGKPASGYFTDCEPAIKAMAPYEGAGIYATLNVVKQSCYGRSQRDAIMMSPKSTTNDNDIESRGWILIDLDPVRPSDTNSSDEEKRHAESKMRDIFKFLRKEGFNNPIVADSGNGYHLYYKVDMPNTPESTETVKNFLQALDAFFSDDKVTVDTSVSNASRIVKIIGTSSSKGANTEDRPQRESSFIYVPEPVVATPVPYVEKVAGYFPKPEQPSRFNGYSTDKFDLDGFISRHNIEVVRRSRFAGGEKIILKQCPFDPNHKDAAILHLDNGAIAFKCFHNSCSQYGWKDFRVHFDPSAYTQSVRDEYRYKRTYYSYRESKPVVPQEDEAKGKRVLSMNDIKWTDPSDIIHIPTGILKLDKLIGGFALGDITVLSGSSGSGKTTILDTFALSAVQRGYNVFAWSGELPDYRFQGWIDQMAAGREMVRQNLAYDNLYYCPRDVAKKINDWLEGKLWLYNNEYGNEWKEIVETIEKEITEHGVQLILLDNLMAIDFETPSDNDVQTAFIKDVKALAKKYMVHIVVVCHPRKEMAILRKESIAGTANLTNLCDNLLIIHRIGKDFEKRAKEFFTPADIAACAGYQLIVEIAKNRSQGIVDEICRLYYEKETRRILNEEKEHIIYGWLEPTTPAPMFSFPEPYKPEPPAIRYHDEPEEDIPDDAWDEEAEDKLKNQS